jgi:hypothetical protein
MDEPLAVALKFGFLAVLYLFLLWVVRSAMRDLGRVDAAVAAEPAEPPGPSRRVRAPSGPDLRAGVDPQLVVVAAMGYEPGTTFDVGAGATMGRSDNDACASSAHARIFPRGEYMYVEDMGSTNGTYLNGRQVKTPERLKMADLIRIGDSEYRYEE